MRSDPNPLFRKIIMPWYDNTLACWILLLFMAVLVFFGVMGHDVARQHPAYQQYVWVPWAVIVPSVLVGLSVSLRLIRRYQLHHRDDVELS